MARAKPSLVHQVTQQSSGLVVVVQVVWVRAEDMLEAGLRVWRRLGMEVVTLRLAPVTITELALGLVLDTTVQVLVLVLARMALYLVMMASVRPLGHAFDCSYQPSHTPA